jgi:hypothetical protein
MAMPIADPRIVVDKQTAHPFTPAEVAADAEETADLDL